jgi:Exportin-T
MCSRSFETRSVSRHKLHLDFELIRFQTRFAFARIIATTGPNVTHFIPPLMVNLLAHFEPSELVDFMNFIGLLIHKLQVRTHPETVYNFTHTEEL